MSHYQELLIGCGHARDKRIEPRQCLKETSLEALPSHPAHYKWSQLETLDYEGLCNPDIVWDISRAPWCRPIGEDHHEPDAVQPLSESSYDEVHAYEVLEHVGQQGDFRAFFKVFSEIWRVLKPGGLLAATCPSRFSEWYWGDPGHTQGIPPAKLIFLSQEAYTDQQGRTQMTDYRRVYHADFTILHSSDDKVTHLFVLQAVKPSRQGLAYASKSGP
jgi:SAM-dependent methyltransferase